MIKVFKEILNNPLLWLLAFGPIVLAGVVRGRRWITWFAHSIPDLPCRYYTEPGL